MVAYLEGYIDHMNIRHKFHTNMNVTNVVYNHEKSLFQVETTHNLTGVKLNEEYDYVAVATGTCFIRLICQVN